MDSADASPSFQSSSILRAGLVVVAITFLAYLPAIFHSFVEWDDVTVIAGNPLFNPVSWKTVGHYWTHLGENLYIPVTYTLWAGLARMGELGTADAIGSRLNPYLFHLASVVLHASAALAVYLLMVRVVRLPWAAAGGALFFALHPIQVESVAFIGAMNTPLAAALGLWAAWLYLQSADESPPRRWKNPSYLFASALMLAAMLSKPTAVVLPVIALLFDLSGNRRMSNWLAPVIAVLPWIGLSAACAVCARLFQTASAIPPSTPWNHLLVAADAGLFYLHKLVAPWPLAIDYGRHPQFSQNHLGLIIASLSAILFIFFIAIDRITTRARPGHQHLLILAILLAIVGLLPNSGLMSFDFQLFSTVADRYVYLAMLGPSLIVATALGWSAQRARATRLTAATGCLLILLALIAMTEKQLQTWTDGTTLFHHAVAVNPNSWMSYANLAYIEADTNPDLAMADCRKSISLNRDNAIAWNTLGTLLMARGERAAAIDAFDFAHRLQPDAALFSHNAATARRSGVAIK